MEETVEMDMKSLKINTEDAWSAVSGEG